MNDLEVLVCDDGSTDDTFEKVSAIKDPRVRWISGKRGGRPAIPRNNGIREAKGEWLAFLDSDDEWLPEKLEKQIALAEKLNLKAASSNASRFIPKEGIIGDYFSFNKDRITFDDLLKINEIVCSSSLIHASLLKSVISFPEEEALKALEDYAFWLRVATKTDFAFLTERLVVYRDDTTNSVRANELVYIWDERERIFGNFISWGEQNKIPAGYLKKALSKKYPEVTVLMPVYNGEKYLRESIESILNQTFKDFEFLIINDGSTDGSVLIVEEYKVKDPRIRLVHNKVNMNIIPTLNRGIELAHGKYIARMDCDDIALPKRLEKQVKFMEKNQNVDICGSWIRMFDKADSVVEYPENHEEIKCALLFYNALAHPTIIMRKSFLDKNNVRYSKPPAEDYELWQRLSFKTRLCNIPEILLNYRVSGANYSQVNTVKIDALLDELIAISLKKMGVEANESNIKLHKKIGQAACFGTARELIRARYYLARLIKANKKVDLYPKKEFYHTLFDLWMRACVGSSVTTGKKMMLLLFFPLGSDAYLNKKLYGQVLTYTRVCLGSLLYRLID
jgi:glycosyltransferase involved in cell wall biosynthesis